MESTVGTQLQEAHALLDVLPSDKIAAVRHLLEVMVEPFARSLALAPLDEEGELNADTVAAIEEPRAQFARGEFVSHEEVLREFGL